MRQPAAPPPWLQRMDSRKASQLLLMDVVWQVATTCWNQVSQYISTITAAATAACTKSTNTDDHFTQPTLAVQARFAIRGQVLTWQPGACLGPIENPKPKKNTSKNTDGSGKCGGNEPANRYEEDYLRMRPFDFGLDEGEIYKSIPTIQITDILITLFKVSKVAPY